jgi:hypothetical protein
LLNDLVRDAKPIKSPAAESLAQRLSYRLVRSAEESKIAAFRPDHCNGGDAVYQRRRWQPILVSRGWAAQSAWHILEQVQLALDNAQENRT